jgi:hypothetical protein
MYLYFSSIITCHLPFPIVTRLTGSLSRLLHHTDAPVSVRCTRNQVNICHYISTTVIFTKNWCSGVHAMCLSGTCDSVPTTRVLGYSLFRTTHFVHTRHLSSLRTPNSGVPRNFVRGGVQQIQLRTEGRENGDLGVVAP